MTRSLKVMLFIYGVIVILMGLVDIFMPDLLMQMYGFGEVAGIANYFGEIISAIFMAIGVWTIVAARDPLRYIIWLKFVITMSLFAITFSVHSMLVGYVDFSQISTPIIFHGFFAVVFLVLYPWGATRTSEQ